MLFSKVTLSPGDKKELGIYYVLGQNDIIGREALSHKPFPKVFQLLYFIYYNIIYTYLGLPLFWGEVACK
jgi:hypothetical protein